jgi:hypothetical protein
VPYTGQRSLLLLCALRQVRGLRQLPGPGRVGGTPTRARTPLTQESENALYSSDATRWSIEPGLAPVRCLAAKQRARASARESRCRKNRSYLRATTFPACARTAAAPVLLPPAKPIVPTIAPRRKLVKTASARAVAAVIRSVTPPNPRHRSLDLVAIAQFAALSRRSVQSSLRSLSDATPVVAFVAPITSFAGQ